MNGVKELSVSTETNKLAQPVLNKHKDDGVYESDHYPESKSRISEMGSYLNLEPSSHNNVEEDEQTPFTEDEQTPFTEDEQTQLSEENKYAAPDGGWGWLIVLGSFLNHAILNGLHKCGGVVYLQLLERFQMSATATSWAIAIHDTLTLILGPLVSALCTKFSMRFVVYTGAILTTVGSLISGFSPNIVFMYFSYGVLTGVGRAMAYSPSLVIVGHYFNKRRGLAVGLASSGGGVGNIFFPSVVEMLFDFYGFAGALLILAAINSHFLISGSLFRSLDLHQRLTHFDRCMQKTARYQLKDVKSPTIKSTRKSANNSQMFNKILKPKKEQPVKLLLSKEANEQHAPRASSETKKSRVDILLALSHLKNVAFTTLCLLLLLFDSVYGITFVFLPALIFTKGLTHLEGAYILGITGIFNTLSRLFISILLDLKRIKPFRLWIYNLLMFLLGVVAVIIPSLTTFLQFAVIGSVFGILTGTCVSQISLVVIDILGVENLSSSYGVLMFFRGIGSLIGPVIGGMLKDLLGSYEAAFYFGSIGSFVGALMFAAGNIWLHIDRISSITVTGSNTANI